MVSFSRSENKTIVKVEHGVFDGKEFFQFDIQQAYEYQAELLRKQLLDNLGNHLQKIREEAYNQGWKDAKAKTRKQTWFSRWW